MNEVKQIRLIQLTASLVLRMNCDIEIEQANSELYDIVMVTHGDRSKCLVRVVDDEFIVSGEIKEYLDVLHHPKTQEYLGGYPLCLMKVDERNLAIDFQVIARDEWSEYEIEREVNFCRLNDESLKWLIGETRQWNHIITILRRDIHGIIKSIWLNHDSHHHEIPARIIYIRDFTPDYRMSPQVPSNNDEAKEKRENVHMQKEFPNDILDNAIIEAVNRVYPEARLWNDLLVTTDKYKALLRQQKMQKMESAQIRISPDLSAVPQEQLAWIRTMEALCFEVDIFVEPAPIDHLYDNEGFEVRLPMNDWVNTLNRYSQVLRTLHRVRDVIR